MDRSMTSRRSFLIGLGSALAAPAIVRADSLMKIVVPKPRILTLAEWAKIAEDSIEKMIRPPMVASSEIFNLPLALIPGCITYVGHDIFQGREIIAADWPSRTIKAPPGGFKIERA